MKRALAERAKLQQSVQSSPPPQQQPPNAPKIQENGSSPQEPPLKVPRIEKPQPSEITKPPEKPAAPEPRPTSPRPRKTESHKRRLSAASNKPEEVEDNASSFYLKHQNRALATELKSLRHSLNELEEERDVRRQQTKAAFENILQVLQIWNNLEQTTVDIKYNPSDPPSSGTTVEWIDALESAIVSLGGEQADTLDSATANIARRAQSLQEWLAAIIRTGTIPSTENPEHKIKSLQSSLDSVTSRVETLQAELAEVAHSRQDIAQRERQLRRNVYRLSTGILTQEQLMQKVEGPDDDELKASVQLEKQNLKTEEPQPVESTESIPASQISDQQVQEFQFRIKSLENAVQAAEKAVQDLNTQISEKERRITELSQKQLSEESAQKLETIESTNLQLEMANEKIATLEQKLVEKTEQWSIALGNEKAALASVEENLSKFNKRWSEVTNEAGENDDEDEGEISPEAELAKELGQVRHQLTQALENVRQAETARENLKLAISMNKEQKARLDETTEKYETLLKSSEASGESDAPAEKAPSKSSSRSNDKTLEKYQKLKKEYQSIRSKLEHAEKDRDNYMESNFQLLQQVSEKDEMNAKSLSTILHLKKMTEKLTEERETLEQTAKSASQLALAARLATNAKERVSEEVVKEKEALEERVQELEEACKSKQAELDRVTSEWSEASGKMAVKDTELANALKRSEELVADNEQKREEIRRLVEVVSKTEQEAKDSKEKLSEVLGQASSGESGAIELLKTQISVLKGRLACPVCHYRDKECIILRCRHMHCKQCVDERISNRSRKCPTCNIKFSENDVGDVWLS